MKNKSKIALLVIMVFAASCEEYSNIIKDARENKSKHPEQRYFDDELEPLFPDDSDNNKRLVGIDNNNNGIRDDIDIWINYVGRDYNHRMALRQLAKVETKRLVAGASKNSRAYDQIAKDITDGFACTSFFEFHKYGDEERPSMLISNLVYNNSVRQKAYENFHRSTIVYKSNIEDLNVDKQYLACNYKFSPEIVK